MLFAPIFRVTSSKKNWSVERGKHDASVQEKEEISFPRRIRNIFVNHLTNAQCNTHKSKRVIPSRQFEICPKDGKKNYIA